MSEPAPKYRATVTRRPVAEPVDAAERIRQSEHYQAAVQAANAAATAMQAEPAVPSIGPIRTRYSPRFWPDAWVSRLLSIW